jgi:hypothetical protein
MKPFKLPRFVRVMEQAERLCVAQGMVADVVDLSGEQKGFINLPSTNRK